MSGTNINGSVFLASFPEKLWYLNIVIALTSSNTTVVNWYSVRFYFLCLWALLYYCSSTSSPTLSNTSIRFLYYSCSKDCEILYELVNFNHSFCRTKWNKNTVCPQPEGLETRDWTLFGNINCARFLFNLYTFNGELCLLFHKNWLYFCSINITKKTCRCFKCFKGRGYRR